MPAERAWWDGWMRREWSTRAAAELGGVGSTSQPPSCSWAGPEPATLGHSRRPQPAAADHPSEPAAEHPRTRHPPEGDAGANGSKKEK